MNTEETLTDKIIEHLRIMEVLRDKSQDAILDGSGVIYLLNAITKLEQRIEELEKRKFPI